MKNDPRPRHKPIVLVLRWLARTWSLLVLILALVIALSPDPYQTHAMTLEEGFMLSLWAIPILGLILAWWKEKPGAIITLTSIVLREVIYIMTHRDWTVNFLLVWALVVPPAIMYLVAWKLDHPSRVESKPTTGEI